MPASVWLVSGMEYTQSVCLDLLDSSGRSPQDWGTHDRLSLQVGQCVSSYYKEENYNIKKGTFKAISSGPIIEALWSSSTSSHQLSVGNPVTR